MSTDCILETRNLVKDFKGFVAVNDVNLKVRRGSIHALIGPNGDAVSHCFVDRAGGHVVGVEVAVAGIHSAGEHDPAI